MSNGERGKIIPPERQYFCRASLGVDNNGQACITCVDCRLPRGRRPGITPIQKGLDPQEALRGQQELCDIVMQGIH